MRILTVHNHYQQLGGEDTIFQTECDLLESYGHQVIRYTKHNDQVKEMSSMALVQTTLWNRQVYQELRQLIRQKKPQVAHFHNTFPLISPAAYHAVKDEGVPVVQTLHNFRLLCANGLFFREGHVCEDCLGKAIPWPSVVHRCYRESQAASLGVTAMVKFHEFIKTWTQTVDTYIVYSQFALEKFLQNGIPNEKVEFKTNFLYPVPELGTGQGGYALFVGRLSPEKGIGVFLNAWKKLHDKIPLKILGDGPLAPQVKQAAQELSGVEWLGRQPLSKVYELMGEAKFVLITSEWYETFGRVGIEAMATGTPLIVSEIGALAELVEPHYNGFRFRPGDSDDLVTQVEWIFENPEEFSRMRHSARADFEAKYTAPDNYRRLMEIYQLVGAT